MEQLKTKLQAIKAEKDKILADDLPNTKTIFGITGTVYEVPVTNNYAGECLDIYDNYNEDATTIAFAGTVARNSPSILLRPGGRLNIGVKKSEIVTTIKLTPAQIAKGQTVLGVTGTYEGADVTTTEDYQTCITLANEILGVTE